MKNIKMLIALLLISFNVSSQEKGRNVPIKDVATFHLPPESTELTLQKLESSKQQGKKSELDFFSAGKNFNGSIFHLKESKLVLIGTVGKVSATFLEDQKKGIDHVLKTNRNYTSSIKNFNNYKILIMTYDAMDYNYVRFITLNDKLSSSITGTIEYNSADKNDVDKMLNDFLKGLKFKT